MSIWWDHLEEEKLGSNILFGNEIYRELNGLERKDYWNLWGY